MEDFGSIIEGLKVPPDDVRFYKRAFVYTSRRLKERHFKEGDNFKRVVAEEYGDLSRRIDKSRFQEGCAVRNVLRTRRLANLLVNDEGELNLPLIPRVIKHLREHLYFLGPDRQYDGPRGEHLLKVLESLERDKNLQRQLKLISKPYAHKTADQIIRDSLQLPPNHPVTDAHARRAVLASWMCYLRQNVGSCFATAPAILVQSEQPELFLKDMNELLGTGRLKRTFGGIEYSVPLSASWGAGDLRKTIITDRNDREALEDLGYSPGILLALEATGLIDPEKSLKERIEACKVRVSDILTQLEDPHKAYLITTAEEIISLLLMRHFGITAKDLQDYENRPRGMLHTSLMMSHPSPSSGMGGKGESCTNYLAQFEVAKSAFKGLADNALLKTWEFTIASFAETKPGFTRWNMYASLGYNPEERGGIANCLYDVIKAKLDQTNAKMQDYQFEYEQSYNQLKYIEARMRSASTEKEVQWIKIEYETRRNEFRTLEELRDREHFKAGRYANLLNDILESYDELFPRYFQEVYDADMHEVATGPYDDSPAGFRLLYKHGRANTSQWTLIYTPQEFIEALSSFFVATEPELVSLPKFEGMQQEISDLVTRLVTHIKTEEFLITAFQRMATAHNAPLIKDPLEHLDKIDKKPWAYTSGGTMNNLISCYFRLEGKPTEQGRWVENPMELMVFFVDTLKQMPPKLLEEYLASPSKALLMHSPTHAFPMIPAMPQIKAAVTSEAFSYTWIRDHLVQPPDRFNEYLFLDEEMMEFLIEKFAEFVPINYRHRFTTVFAHPTGRKNPREFRSYLVDTMEQERGLNIGGESVLDPDRIDSALFAWLPLFKPQELYNRGEKLWGQLPGLTPKQQESIRTCFEEISSRFGKSAFVTAKQLQSLSKAVLCLALRATSGPIDYPRLISENAQKLGYAMPKPVLFADTNWVKDYFAFMINPGTGKLDLWRVDYIGSEGAPMSMWRQWLNGSDQSRTWAIYTKPYEYKSLI